MTHETEKNPVQSALWAVCVGHVGHAVSPNARRVAEAYEILSKNPHQNGKSLRDRAQLR